MSIKVQSYVWENSTAKGSSLLLLLAIADHAHDDGTGAWPSIERLAEKCRQTPRNVQALLRKLEQAGELQTAIGEGPHGCNAYAIPMGGEKFSGVKASAPGVKTSVKMTRQISPEPSLEPSLEPSDGDEQKTLVTPSQEYLPENQTTPKAQELVDTCGIDFQVPAPRERLTTEERIQRLAGAMDAAMSRQGTAAEVAAAIADPRADKRAFVKRFAPLVGAIFCRDAIGEDRAVAGDVWAFHCEPEWLAGRLTAYANGDGDEFRQPTRDGKKPTAYWVRARIEREWAEHKGQLNDTRQREQSRAEYERECREAIEAAERGTLFEGWKPDPPPASVYLHGADAGTLRDASRDNVGDEGIAVAAARELRVQPDGLAVRPVPWGKVDCYSRGRVPKMQRQVRAVPGLHDGQGPGSSTSTVDAGVHPRQPAPGRDADGTG